MTSKKNTEQDATASTVEFKLPDQLEFNIKDLGGAYRLKDRLIGLVKSFRNPELGIELGGKKYSPIQNMLLYGPPGTGKTMFGEILAKELGMRFGYISCGSLENQFVGVGSNKVKNICEQADEDDVWTLLLWDELDAIVGREQTSVGAQTLLELMTQMTIRGRKIIHVACTNRIESLDAALVNRFPIKIEVPNPTLAERREIIQVQSRELRLDPNDMPVNLAELTEGQPGRTIRDVMTEAVSIAVKRIRISRDKKRTEGMSEPESRLAIPSLIGSGDCYEALLNVLYGARMPGGEGDPAERRNTLVHEAGHWFAAEELRDQGNYGASAYVFSIEPRSRALGFVYLVPEPNRDRGDRRSLVSELTVGLAGAAFQKVLLGIEDSGLASDVQTVTRVARMMVEKVAMSERIGTLCIDPARISDKTRQTVDEEIKRLVDEAWKVAIGIAEKYKFSIFPLCHAVLTEGTIYNEQLRVLFAEAKADALAKLSDRTQSREYWEAEFVRQMQKLKEIPANPFPRTPQLEEVDWNDNIKPSTEASDSVEAAAMVTNIFFGPKVRAQLVFHFKNTRNLLKQAEGIVEVLERDFQMTHNGTLMSSLPGSDSDCDLIIEVLTTEAAIERYLASNTHRNVRRVKPEAFARMPLPSSEVAADVIGFLVETRTRSHHWTVPQEVKSLTYNFDSRNEMHEAVNDIVSELEFEFGLRVLAVSHSNSAPWSLKVDVVESDSTTLDRYYDESRFSEKLAA